MRRFAYFCLKIFTILGLIGLLIASALIYYYSKDLPDYSQLANYHPPSVTRIYSADGKLIEEYAYEHRVFVPISSIPRSLIEAFIAAEDKNFYNHPGIDIFGIIRAAITNISNLMHHRRMEGASTITQQVVKNFLLSSERSLSRKVKEAILSYRISQIFSKEQILELYLNQTFLGRGYGVAIATQNYFNKSVDELNLAESAFIAGLPKAPSNYDPQRNYNKAKERRDYVITRMLEDGYITKEAADEAIKSPITLVKRDKSETVSAGYYAEQVREEVIKMLGKEQFYTAGLTIVTSLDANIQNAAMDALRRGIRSYDTKKGYRGPLSNIDIADWQNNLNKTPLPSSLLEYELAVVLEVSDSQVKIGLKDGNIAKIVLADMKWAKSNLKSAKDILKKGNVIVVEAIKSGYGLRQIPAINGAIMVMNHATGQVLAAQGGYDFDASKFDRSTQALRQPGSLSKTFVYLAALENGMQPNRIFDDAPITISQGPGMPAWKPKNYKGDFLGSITMRTGLEKSRNLITVRVAQAIGLGKVAEMVRRFGINDHPKKLYSMVLGSLETTLERMVTAYATIANQGYKVTPHFVELIKDRNGKVIYRRDKSDCKHCTISDNELDAPPLPEFTQVPQQRITDEATNYQMISFLTGVVERGTAASAKKLNLIIAGKTGTTNNSKDTWFVGFTPRITVGTYIGYDTPKDMGKRDTGGTVALPVFIDFMEQVYKDKLPSLPFKVPARIRLVSVDPSTGSLSTAPNAIMEAFKTDNKIFKFNEQEGGLVPVDVDAEDSDAFDGLGDVFDDNSNGNTQDLNNKGDAFEYFDSNEGNSKQLKIDKSGEIY